MNAWVAKCVNVFISINVYLFVYMYVCLLCMCNWQFYSIFICFYFLVSFLLVFVQYMKFVNFFLLVFSSSMFMRMDEYMYIEKYFSPMYKLLVSFNCF